ncbi:MAG TPA: nuclear transport factor 2 family protein [Nitrososphaeraceae archaeon]|jgi:SnoaL-like domain|nr:nuclear transport factor 2 family protein [Nitrososphaeraceae archaeon]
MLKDLENANAQFYDAFEKVSINMMENIWSHNDDCICIHPGWEMFIGWLAIRESWLTIFSNTENLKFTITNTKIKLYEDVAGIITCVENIKMIINERKIFTGVVATNIFEYDGDQRRWLLVYHHGSPISDYLPPTNSY